MKIKIGALLGLVISLSACHYDMGLGNHDNNYLKDDQSLALFNVPADTHIDTRNMNKTLLPAFNQNSAEVSIYPPDALNLKATSLKPPAPKASIANGISAQSIVVQSDLKHSWVKVGTALKKSGYRIIDQDQTTYCFYVLDVRGKGRALNEASPLYVVELHAQSAKLTRVTISTKNDQPVPPGVAKEILNNIAAKLR